MNANEITALCKVAHSTMSKTEVTPELSIAWSLQVSEFTFEEGREALKALMSEDRKFPPLPGELRKEILRQQGYNEALTKKSRSSGPTLETFQREVIVGGKKELREYVRATTSAKKDYAQNAERRGRKFRELTAKQTELYEEPALCVEGQLMQMLFQKLEALLEDYGNAKTDEARARCDARRDDLKQFYFDLGNGAND